MASRQSAEQLTGGTERVESSIVAILGGSGTPVGVGFLISPRHVVTCAHVIVEALSLEKAPKRRPTTAVKMRFPFSAVESPGKRSGPAVLLSAKVREWYPQDDNAGNRLEDVAVLVLARECDTPLPFLTDVTVTAGRECEAFGYPERQDDGIWATGECARSNERGWVLIDDERTAGYAISQGFSGGPVFDQKTGGILGMVIAVDDTPERRVAYMLPWRRLDFPEMKLERLIPATEGERKEAAGIPPPPPEFRNSLGQLPPPGNADLFVGRDRYISDLDKAWAKKTTTIIQIVADGGIGKTALVWHWLERLKKAGYPGVTSAMDWSFYSQGQREFATDSERFFEKAMRHYADNLPAGVDLDLHDEEARANAVAAAFVRQSGLLILDGVEPLQYPPETNNGRMKDEGLATMMRYLRAQPSSTAKPRLLIITTRWELPNLVGEGTESIALAHLDEKHGAKLLTAFRLLHLPERGLHAGPGTSADALRRECEDTVKEYNGHTLALVLLASYLIRQHHGDIRCRHELPVDREARDDDPYRHARRVMRCYDRMFAASGGSVEKACRQVLCLIGLFDRPAPLALLEVLRRDQTIGAVGEGLTSSRFNEALDELQRLRLVNPGTSSGQAVLETHPLIREHFAQVLKGELRSAALEAHLCLFQHLRRLAPANPETMTDMEPLFQSVVHGCKAQRFRTAFYDVYLAQIMRGNEDFAAVRFRVIGPLLTILSHFFQGGDWERPVLVSEIDGEALDAPARLILLLQSGAFLTATKGYSCREVEVTYGQAVALAEELQDDERGFNAMFGLWRNQTLIGNAAQAADHARWLLERAHTRLQRYAALRARAASCVYEAQFAAAREFAIKALCEDSGCEKLGPFDCNALTPGAPESSLCVAAVEMFGCASKPLPDWVRQASNAAVQMVVDPITSCRSYLSLALWHLGLPEEASRCAQLALQRAQKIGHDHTQAVTLFIRNWLSYYLQEPVAAAANARLLVALCEDRGITVWLEAGRLQLAWAEGMQCDTKRAIRETERILADYSKTRAEMFLPLWVAQLVQLYIRNNDAAGAERWLAEGRTLCARKGQHVWKSDLLRLTGIVKCERSARGTLPGEAEELFREASELARTQGSASMQFRAGLEHTRRLHAARRWPEAVEVLRKARAALPPSSITAETSLADELLTRLEGEDGGRKTAGIRRRT